MDAAVHTFPPASPQERLGFLGQLAPGSPFYNPQIDLPLALSVDESLWCRVIAEIVRRHEILRTVFGVIDGQPVQLVMPLLETPVARVDLRELPIEQRE